MSNVLRLPLGSNQPRPNREDRDWVTGPELCTEAGITYRQLDYWTRTNLLTPLDAVEPGSGHLRRYAEDQVNRTRTLRLLLDAGVSLVTCRQVIDQVVETGQVTVGAVTLTLHHSTGDPAA